MKSGNRNSTTGSMPKVRTRPPSVLYSCIVRYRGGIYDQQDATNSQSLLLDMLYMFRAIIAHHQEVWTVCAAVRWYKLCGSLFSRLYSRRGVSVVVHIQFRAPDDGQWWPETCRAFVTIKIVNLWHLVGHIYHIYTPVDFLRMSGHAC
jgi:hypothetical protein